jgi:hypothetical protein
MPRKRDDEAVETKVPELGAELEEFEPAALPEAAAVDSEADTVLEQVRDLVASGRDPRTIVDLVTELVRRPAPPPAAVNAAVEGSDA